jgi:hypothetical protein
VESGNGEWSLVIRHWSFFIDDSPITHYPLPVPMKLLPHLFLTACLLSVAPVALAAEWVSIATNAVGDKFFVDKSSILRRGEIVWFWEYREFPQPNNAFLEETVNQPVHGAVISWSLDCTSKVQRLRQVTAYNKDKKVIQRFSYGDSGSLIQPRSGSSAHKVLSYVCVPPQDGTGNQEKN